MATSSLSVAIRAERAKVRQSGEMREAIGRDPGDVPEEIEIEHAVEAGQAGEPGIGERAVDQRGDVRASSPCHVFSLRKVVQQTKPGVGDQPARC